MLVLKRQKNITQYVQLVAKKYKQYMNGKLHPYFHRLFLMGCVPFGAFFGSYCALSYILAPTSVRVPDVCLLPLQEATVRATRHDLTIRIMREEETTDVEHGTVRAQLPLAGTSVRPGHNLWLTVAKNPAAITPSMINKTTEEIKAISEQEGITLTIARVLSKHMANSCIAQDPPAGTPLRERALTVYITQDDGTRYCMPSLERQLVRDVRASLAPYGASIDLTYATPADAQCAEDQLIVIDHYPPPGSLIAAEAPFYVQLHTKSI
jgi:beta-lactam-binding protein with PASTA domain